MTTPAIAQPVRRILPEYATYGKGISEFIRDPITGVLYNGDCTQVALEICLAAADHRPPSQDHAASITRAMIARAEAATNGGTTLRNIAAEARLLGYRTILEWDYQEPLANDWIAILRAHAGIHPILLQVAQGHNLIDVETHVAPEAAAHGLRYHAIAIVGKQVDGYLCCDGDHPQVSERFQIYPYELTLVAAVPCGLMVLDMPTPPPPPPPAVDLAPEVARLKAALSAIEASAAAAVR